MRGRFYENYKNGNKYIIESVYLNRLKNQKFQGQRGLNEHDYFSVPKKTVEVKGISYRYNNFGFRDKDFNSPADLLISGCSQTWGVELPEEYRFSNIIEKNIEGTVHNISTPGNSVSAIVRTIFAYIKEFGAPKYIYCMMPPFERFEFVPDLERFNAEDIINLKHHSRENFSPLLVGTYHSEYDKVQKAPFAADRVINLETTHFLQMQSLLMLEQYCEALGVKFMWSTWSTWCGMPDTILDLKSKGLGFNSFLDIPFRKWEYSFKNQEDNLRSTEDCHLDLKNKYPEIFHVALDANKFTDRNYDNSQVVAHWGSHRNAHIAEIIIDKIKKGWEIK